MFWAHAQRRRAGAPPVRLVRDTRSRRSSSRPRATTRTCSRSNRRSTAPAATRAAIVASLVKAAERGQAGRGAGRAEGALRRAGQHRTGPRAGGGRRRTSSTGSSGLKTHAKIAARRAPGGRRHPPLLPRRHRQLQPQDRARIYEDLGLLSSDPELGADLSELFNHLTGYSRPGEYRRLLVAPCTCATAARADRRQARRGPTATS